MSQFETEILSLHPVDGNWTAWFVREPETPGGEPVVETENVLMWALVRRHVILSSGPIRLGPDTRVAEVICPVIHDEDALRAVDEFTDDAFYCVTRSEMEREEHSRMIAGARYLWKEKHRLGGAR